MIYTVKAYWPNSTVEPKVSYVGHFAEAIELALAYRATREHTNISVIVDALELLQVWGQPMPNGDDWP